MNDQDRAAELLRTYLRELIAADKAVEDATRSGNEETRFAAFKKRTDLTKTVRDQLAADADKPPDPFDDPALWNRALQDADPFAVLRAALGLPDAKQEPRRAVPVPEVTGDRPKRLLSVAGKKGALLSVGGVLVLAGEGGIAKSPLALSIALAMAARMGNIYGDLHGGLFEGIGGPTLIASYEDWPAVSADRLRKLAALWWPDTETDIGTKAGRVRLRDRSVQCSP